MNETPTLATESGEDFSPSFGEKSAAPDGVRFRRPGTVTLLCTALVGIFLFSWFRPCRGARNDAITGVTMAVLIFCLYASLHFPDGMFKRPAKTLWRMIQALMLVYLMVLVFALFLDVSTVKTAMGVIEPATLAYGEKSYAESCAIYDTRFPDNPWRNVKEKLDVFVIAHLFGWIMKALILRDWVILWLTSIIFEFLEQMLKHILPNFAECWWDHLLMDLFGCNILGISIGMWLCGVFNLKKYRFGCPATSSNERAFGWRRVFYPFNREIIDTKLGGWVCDLTSFRACLWMIFFVELFDLNYFFLKAILNIAPAHPLCILRTFIVGLACASGASEVDDFCEKNRTLKAQEERLIPLSPKAVALRLNRLRHQKLGTHAWLCLAVLGSEALLVIRWRSEGLIHWGIETPLRTYLLGGFWVAVGVACHVWARRNGRQRRSKTQ